MKEETRPPDAIPIQEETTPDPPGMEVDPTKEVPGSPSETAPEKPPPTRTRRRKKSPEKTSATPRTRRPRKKLVVSEETRDQIRELQPFYGARKIGPRVGLSRKVVRRVLDEMGLSPMPDRTSDTSKLDPFQDAIQARVEEDLTATRILREVRAMGYDGGRTILADLVHTLKTQRGLAPSRKVRRRFETGPGRELQIDWSPMNVRIAGKLVMVHVLGCLLCASRMLFLRLFRNERQSTLLEGLASAFEYFGGVAALLVLDNMSTAVLGRIGPDREPLWHPRFLDFIRYYGFDAFACKVRDPDRKGKKEKSFRLVYADFLKGTDFASWEDMEARCPVWLDQTPEAGNLRVHGTTRRVVREAYLEEKPFLIQLPEKRFAVHEDGVRLVDADSTLSMFGTKYTVPSGLANHSVAVRIYAEHFEVLDREGRIAFSRTYVSDEDKGKIQIDKTHYAALPRRPHLPGGERLDEALVQRFPSLAALVQGLQLRFKALAPIHLRALIRAADQYGQEAFLAAALRAQQYRRFDALAVERILAHDHPLPEHDSPALLTGTGPVVLGEVEPGSLDRYAGLDALPATPTESIPPAPTDNPATPQTTTEIAPSTRKEDDHGT